MSVHWLAECMFVGKTERVFIVCTLISWLCMLSVGSLADCVSTAQLLSALVSWVFLTEPGHVRACNHVYATLNQNIQVFKLNISYLLTTECSFDQQQLILIRTWTLSHSPFKENMHLLTHCHEKEYRKEKSFLLQIRFIISFSIRSWYT